MAEHPHVATVKGAIEAFNSGDIESAMGRLSDDVVWHYIGGEEPVRGRAGVVEMFGGAETDFTITAEIHDIVTSDDHVVVLLQAHAERGGQTLDYNVAEIYHVKGDLVTERWAFSDDTARVTQFFA